MTDSLEYDWTLNELVDAANAVLAERALPAVDSRLVRFWRAENLVSQPHGAARGARWGWPHLVELVATRAAQHTGASIRDLAAQRGGLSPTELAATAALPAERPEGWEPPGSTPSEAARLPEQFWDPVADSSPTPAASAAARASTPSVTRSVVELAAGCAVILPAAFATPERLAALAPIFEQLTTALTTHQEDR